MVISSCRIIVVLRCIAHFTLIHYTLSRLSIIQLIHHKAVQNDHFVFRCDPNKCTEDTPNIDPGCKCFYHLNITYGNIVQITFYNFGQGPDGSEAGKGLAHPVHIHGTHFYLMKEVFPNYDNNTLEQQPSDDLPCPQNAINKKCNNLQW